MFYLVDENGQIMAGKGHNTFEADGMLNPGDLIIEADDFPVDKDVQWDFDLNDWVITDYPDILAANIRAERDKLLLEADKTTLKLLTTTGLTEEWKDYLQALRDVPQQSTFPTSVQWPTKP
ncbi:MAG: phage tail assembly chaperone [Candidatus Thiodiazotropha taylori]|uniref:Phage tail assembly chaperone n=1 Tax=Candidatus Thiodiazotropha taylori TaxID=2792791 RepID=A0A9E4K8M2_9GAMM|nr:phage tail assembly chaperone [Candidatus Thiodiazotropha taylori]MCW4255017.1 phage tail assembly chaperone [Candidatus Thiodiazotropha taylori]